MKWLAIIGGFLMTLLAALGMARKSGKDSARREQAEEGLKQARQANETREAVRNMSDDELDKRLRRDQRD